MRALSHPRIGLLSLGLVLAAAACAGRIDHLGNDQLVDHFETVAFGREFSERSDHLIKWTQPVRIWIVGDDIAERHMGRIEFHVAELASLTGHPISIVARTEALAGDNPDANVLMLVAPRSQFQPTLRQVMKDDAQADRLARLMTGNACIGSVFPEPETGLIKAAVVLIPNGEYTDLLMRACIVEEMTQMLGLLNDSDEIKPSIFNDHSRYIDLTEHDRLLLRVLYAPELEPGMGPEEARAAALVVLGRLRPEG